MLYYQRVLANGYYTPFSVSRQEPTYAAASISRAEVPYHLKEDSDYGSTSTWPIANAIRKCQALS
jgi:hypothetical protein